MEKITPVAALRRFLAPEGSGYPPLTSKELAECPKEERRELAELCAVQLGVELTD